MKNVTICLTYFRSLALVNLEAALFSLRWQDMTWVNSIVIVDNNTDDEIKHILAIIDKLNFQVPVCFSSFKHKDSTKTHAWSTNAAVRRTQTTWVLFTRADYILEYGAVEQFVRVAESKPEGWQGFLTSRGMHLSVDVGVVNETPWRHLDNFPALPGTSIDYTPIDTGVWMMPRAVFESVEGLDERLTAWGHAQTHFQHKLYQAGVEFVCIPKILFFHPQHSAPRDLELAHQQLAGLGVDLREMWVRHPGVY